MKFCNCIEILMLHVFLFHFQCFSTLILQVLVFQRCLTCPCTWACQTALLCAEVGTPVCMGMPVLGYARRELGTPMRMGVRAMAVPARGRHAHAHGRAACSLTYPKFFQFFIMWTLQNLSVGEEK